METRANYVAVGAFTLAAILMVFVFILWMGRFQERDSFVPVDIRIKGSVTGLVDGSNVLFNGIRVGRVQGLSLDPAAPDVVIARAMVDGSTPLRSDSRATIGIQGLSGGAYIALEGGTPDAERLLVTSQETGETPMINADPAALADIISRVNNIAADTERILGGLEEFVDENRDDFQKTIRNTAEFSDALARNGENLDKFLTGIGDVGNTLQGFSEKLDGTIAATEKIVQAVNPESVGQTVENIQEFSASLADTREQISSLVTSANTAVANISQFSSDLNTTLKGIDGIVAGIDGEAVSRAVTNIGKAAETASAALEGVDAAKVGKAVDDAAATIASARGILEGVKPETVDTLVTSAADAAKAASDAAKGVSELVEGIDATKVSSAVDSISSAANRANEVLAGVDQTKIGKTVDDVSAAANSARQFLDGLDDTKVSDLVSSAGAAAKQLDTLLAALDATKVNEAVDNVSNAARDAGKVASDFSEVSSALSKRAPDIDRIVADAAELTSRLNGTSQKIDEVIDQANTLLSSDTADGLAADARATLAAFRRTARDLSASVTDISRGITRFTDRGLADTQQLINNASNSLNRLDRVIRGIESDPASVIRGSGGSRVREAQSSRPRR